MSHNKIREDKTCLNCNHVVDQRFCPNCGQENIETRKSFHQLFVHFFEDLTHYENSFWKTIRNLILKPASLTKEYLSGKRMSYLAPIRLYIFISFVTFFVVAIIPDDSDKKEVISLKDKNISEKKTDSITFRDSIPTEKWVNELEKKGIFNSQEADSINIILEEAKKRRKEKSSESYMNFGYDSLEELDSVQKYGKDDDKLNSIEYWFVKKTLEVKKGRTEKEVKDRFLESFFRNIPKALFIYMPLFAFVLWLFHSKKKWYYFDHGIFTLHYFSFLLLASLILELIGLLLGLFDFWIINKLNKIIDFIIIVYMLYYFFPAHHRFYQQSRIKTIIKGIIIFFINIIILTVILIGIALFSFISIH